MAEIGRCETCRHWDADPVDADRGGNRWGLCQKGGSDGNHPETKDTLAYATALLGDRNDGSADLWTSEVFGCVMHEPRPA